MRSIVRHCVVDALKPIDDLDMKLRVKNAEIPLLVGQ